MFTYQFKVKQKLLIIVHFNQSSLKATLTSLTKLNLVLVKMQLKTHQITITRQFRHRTIYVKIK